MLKLGVNIDHVATIREARYRGLGHGEPCPVQAALAAAAAGAHGITAHLREDRRHIQDRDVFALREKISTRLNLEMANAPEIIAIALKVKPEIVCIVPERRLEVTTEGGLDVVGAEKSLTETCQRMKDAGIEVSLFIAPDEAQIAASARTGAQFIELHTGKFAAEFKPAAPPNAAGKRRASWLPGGQGVMIQDQTAVDGKIVSEVSRKWMLSADGKTMTVTYFIDETRGGQQMSYESKRVFNKVE